MMPSSYRCMSLSSHPAVNPALLCLSAVSIAAVHPSLVTTSRPPLSVIIHPASLPVHCATQVCLLHATFQTSVSVPGVPASSPICELSVFVGFQENALLGRTSTRSLDRNPYVRARIDTCLHCGLCQCGCLREVYPLRNNLPDKTLPGH